MFVKRQCYKRLLRQRRELFAACKVNKRDDGKGVSLLAHRGKRGELQRTLNLARVKEDNGWPSP